MKKIINTFFALTFSITLIAQAPEKLSFQAVVRNASNVLITNSSVGVQISILSGSSNGPSVYTERQTINTNTNGLMSLEVGSGIVISGNFATINWASNTYFIKSEIDPSGGTNYTIVGTSQLLSVPYALSSADNRWTTNGSNISNSNTGNVGIGVNNPSEKLVVNGAIVATANASNLALRLDPNTGNPGYELFSDINGLNFCESGIACDRLFLANGGRIGMNTYTPLRNLHLRHEQFTGVGGFGGFEIENAANAARWTIYSSQSTSNLRLFFNDVARGDFDATSGNYLATSDSRLKKNIMPIGTSLEKIMALKPSRYEYIDNIQPGKVYLGFVAQELIKVLPEVVSVKTDSDGADQADLHLVSYSEIIPVLTAGIQEQQVLINNQQKKIESLEQQIAELIKLMRK